MTNHQQLSVSWATTLCHRRVSQGQAAARLSAGRCERAGWHCTWGTGELQGSPVLPASCSEPGTTFLGVFSSPKKTFSKSAMGAWGGNPSAQVTMQKAFSYYKFTILKYSPIINNSPIINRILLERTLYYLRSVM